MDDELKGVIWRRRTRSWDTSYKKIAIKKTGFNYKKTETN
jgi:hypothetical protein